MEIFIPILIIVGVCLFLLSFNVIFRKMPFPDGEISRNKELRKRGIICAKEEELRMLGKIPKNSGHNGENCEGCALFGECNTRKK